MPGTDYTVSLTANGPSPQPLAVNSGDKVTFTNDMTVSTALTLPQCFAGNPTSPITIAAGASSDQYVVTGNPGNDYEYTYTAPSLTATDQAGTIDVS